MSRDAMQVLSDRYERELARKSTDQAAPVEIEVPGTPDVFCAVAARNYAEADDAFWALRQTLRDRGNNFPSQAQLDHLQDLRDRRKAAYADLLTRVLAVEAMRLNCDPRRIRVTAAPVEAGL